MSLTATSADPGSARRRRRKGLYPGRTSPFCGAAGGKLGRREGRRPFRDEPLGMSQGSFIGSSQASLFPGDVRAMAIDGVLGRRLWSSGRHVFELSAQRRVAG
jgi:hypothetical protein